MNKNHRYFLHVAHHGSIKHAAESLKLSQPSLTSAIKKLESQLGVALFERRSKGVELTEYGHVFLRYAREQQDKHLEMVHSLNELSQRQFGRIKLGTGEAWWECFVKESVKRYQLTAPSSSFHLEFGNNLSLMHHLIRGELDLFIGHEVANLSAQVKVRFIPLFQECEAYYAHPLHPLLLNDAPLNQLEEFPLLRATPDHIRHGSMLIDQPQTQNPQQQPDNQIIYDVDSLSASIDMLLMTQAVMPYTDKLQAYLKAKGLSCIAINHDKIASIGIYVPLGKLPDKVESLITQIKLASQGSAL